MNSIVRVCLYSNLGRQPDPELNLIPETVFDKLKEIYPQGVLKNPKNQERIDIRLPQIDERLQKILRILESFGFTPKGYSGRKGSNEFRLQMKRTYDQSDIDEAEYLIPSIEDFICTYASRKPNTYNGTLCLDEKNAKPQYKLASAGFEACVVNEEFRGAMQKADIRYPKYKEIEIRETGKTFIGHWELTSDLILPPLANASLLLNNDGAPFDGDYDKGCFLIEGCYNSAEFHYKRSTLEQIGAFDLAKTVERFGNKDAVSYPCLIASRRFYDFCQEQKLKVNWRPVRVDAE